MSGGHSGPIDDKTQIAAAIPQDNKNPVRLNKERTVSNDKRNISVNKRACIAFDGLWLCEQRRGAPLAGSNDKASAVTAFRAIRRSTSSPSLCMMPPPLLALSRAT